MTTLVRRGRASLLVAAILVAAGCGRERVPDPIPHSAAPIHVRVVWTADPQHSTTVSWTTSKDTVANLLRIESSATDARTVPATLNGAFDRNAPQAPELWFHHARVAGLTPSTTYRFTVESDGEASRQLWFVTAPADDRAVTILAGSDSRTDRDQRRVMNRRIAELVKKDPTILALAHGGDYVWSGTSVDLFADWLSDFELTVTPDGHVLPIIPTRGNHESGGELFDQIFDAPGGGVGQNYYALRLSPQVLLVTLNTETAAGGSQAEFLERTLADAADVRWKFAQYHRALWPAVKKDADAKPHWVPLFERFGLDVALESDGHVLKRTVPIRNDEPAADGVVYIGEGGLGVKQRTPKSDAWYLQPPGFATSAHHVWRLRFAADAAELTAIGEDGEILDATILRPRR